MRPTAASLLLAAAVACAAFASSAQPSSSVTAPPLLASTAGEAAGPMVDGMECSARETLLFHIHAHLAVFVDGRRRTIPRAIGIPQPRRITASDQGPFVVGDRCYYRMHSHTADGVIHIESPVQRTYTLGDYFDIWRQPLSAEQVGPDQGPVTVYVNGVRFRGDPRTAPLTAQALVQVDVGTEVPPQGFTFPPGL
ncbi:MAG: hypothetical protein E6I76_00080 [Chloroflexi bacterium]|nr:MAG: hypothetical protein E6I76_00080 [Chloroflexota bacterium]